MNGSTSRTLRLALLAILQLAVLLFPLPAANALPQVTATEFVVEQGHLHDQTSGAKHANLSTHAADHSHDVPGAVTMAVPLTRQARNCWQQAESQTALLGRLSDIDRPPRGQIPA